ncbi:MAG: SMC-Scp complex subunit ScpB [Phycisphaerae bacterium]|nr:SMC-Scp complex subunit ScpB [Phycisphaerae bacterium]MBM91510.1 SMC-Scp complex subunit ScpB [Phycisphaerae bacterium]MBM92620.1 SMC-Scp complex subunit ScpB [Phycisphaerae bacterium]HCT45595.1 SMC-Scp complex subunit ScpB [Phycisphaerales bacterium]|tara:strand:+ start:246 stop:926 length:681 start_codon:yes stop_codon:yes gene_type:complete
MSVEATSQDAQSTETAPMSKESPSANPQPDPESIPQPEHDPVDLTRVLAPIEAMLVSSDRPLKVAAITDAMGVFLDQPIPSAQVAEAIATLNTQYSQQGRAFTIEEVSGGYRMMTLPEHAPVIAAMHRSRATTRLSKPALETLAIIAYRQPVTRAELEAIRGVACGEVVRTLMERRLVKITGRAEELGRPMLYGTTRQFLDTFGLASVKDLPKPEDFADQLNQSGV